MVRDLYVTKNAHTDKTGWVRDVTYELFGDSFLFAKNDNVWKMKRKACAQAFYKEKLVSMAETIKNKTEDRIQKWQKEIYEKGEASIDLTTEFEDLFARLIVTASFGVDVTQEILKINVFDESTGINEVKELTLSASIRLVSK